MANIKVKNADADTIYTKATGAGTDEDPNVPNVTIATALPAGTNGIGKLTANSGVDIGDVDVTSIAAGDNNIGNVDIVTVPADPFGANADAAVVAGAVGSIQGKLRAISRDIGTVAAAVSTDVQVDVVGALPAGTNAIGKLAANNGVDIGDVDVASIAAGDNNIGNVDIVTVPADPFGANADELVDAGAVGSIQAKLRRLTSDLGAIKTAVELLDDAVGGTELQVDVVGALPAGTNAIGKLAANSGVDIGDVDVTSIAAGDNNIGNVDIVTVPADPFGANADAAVAAGADGSIQAKLRRLTADLGTLIGAVSGTEVQVDVVAALPAGTNAIGKLAANSGVDIGDVDVTSLPASSLVTPTTFVGLSAVDIEPIATVWTPASGKKFRLMGGSISVSAAVNVLFEDNAAGAGNFVYRTPKLEVDKPFTFNLGNGVLSAAADQVLKATASADATITGTIWGKEE